MPSVWVNSGLGLAPTGLNQFIPGDGDFMYWLRSSGGTAFFPFRVNMRAGDVLDYNMGKNFPEFLADQGSIYYNNKLYALTQAGKLYIFDIASTSWGTQILPWAPTSVTATYSARLQHKLYSCWVSGATLKLLEYDMAIGAGRIITPPAGLTATNLSNMCSYGGNRLYFIYKDLSLVSLNLSTMTITTIAPATQAPNAPYLSIYEFYGSVVGAGQFDSGDEKVWGPKFLSGSLWKDTEPQIPRSLFQSPTTWLTEIFSCGTILVVVGQSGTNRFVLKLVDPPSSSVKTPNIPFRYPTRWMEIANAT